MAKIVSGVRKQVRHDTEQRILAVTAQSAIGDGTLVSAADSWRLLDRLLARGYTRGQLASFLGYKTKALQIKRGGCITGRTKVKVERLYARVEAGLLRRDGDVPRADLRVEQRSALAEAAR